MQLGQFCGSLECITSIILQFSLLLRYVQSCPRYVTPKESCASTNGSLGAETKVGETKCTMQNLSAQTIHNYEYVHVGIIVTIGFALHLYGQFGSPHFIKVLPVRSITRPSAATNSSPGSLYSCECNNSLFDWPIFVLGSSRRLLQDRSSLLS